MCVNTIESRWTRFLSLCLSLCLSLSPVPFRSFPRMNMNLGSRLLLSAGLPAQGRALVCRAMVDDDGPGSEDHGGHGSTLAMTSSFRRFLVSTFEREHLSQVLDCAGGRGQLSFELMNLEGVKSTVIDAREASTINYKKTVERHKRLAISRRLRLARVAGQGESSGYIDPRDIPYVVPDHICQYIEPSMWRGESQYSKEAHASWKRSVYSSNASSRGIRVLETLSRQHSGATATPPEDENPSTSSAPGPTRSVEATESRASGPGPQSAPPDAEAAPVSRFRGVVYDEASGKWWAKIQREDLGLYEEEAAAARAFDAAMRDKCGEDTLKVNFFKDGRENPKRTKRAKSASSQGKLGPMWCWKCGPLGRRGETREPLALAEEGDGFTGYAQHKAFQCPHNAARRGAQISPRELRGAEAEAVVREATLVVGIHPDQATGDIVDFALETGKPFAVVPCCTFAQIFKDRVLKSGKRVRTYGDLVKWIREKDEENIRETALEAPGRNIVLWRPALGRQGCGQPSETSPAG